ncbi:hypothetical protein ACIBTV_27505 [Micromonospora sp. NPDC049366]|uniref:hypothetical protein n=1 Tax=Micromonospora sp. NPDC049366 TaxID=3364271 RepID=UPI00378ADBCD
MSAPTIDPAPAFPLPEGITPDMMAAAALLDAGPVDPDLIPCGRCGEPPLVHDADHPHETPPAYALALAAAAADGREVMADLVEHLDAEHVPSGKKGPSASDAGKCRRALWYRDRPPADYVPRTIDSRRAALGTILHKANAEVRAVRYPWRRYELRVAVPGLDRDCLVDEYDPVLGRVGDLKSAGEAKWAIVGDDGPTADQWAQLRINAYALDFAGYPVRELELIQVNRDTGAEEHFREDYDPAAGLAALDDLIEAATMVEAGVVPPRDGYGPRDWRCQWCPAMDHCWQTARAAELKRSPESLIALGETPDDPSIAWAGREVLTLSKARLELEKREARAKALLQGITPGQYDKDAPDGGVEIVDKWSTSYGYKEAYETIRDLYELPDDVRPPLDQVGDVPKKRSKSTGVTKPRAATRAADRRRPKPKALPAADAAAAAVAAQLDAGGRS